MTAVDARLFEYYYDDSGYYAYILLNGDEQQYRNVRARLADKGFRCLHYGKSYRPANNGRQYQWFIRVFDMTQQDKPSLDSIELFFDDAFGIYSERRRIALLEQERVNLLDEIEMQRQELEEISGERRRFLDEAKEYEGIAGEYDEENRHLKQVVQDLENKAAILQALLEQTRNKVDDVQKELNQRHGSADGEVPRRFANEFAAILQCLLPDVEFLEGSIDVLASELEDYRPALRLLRKLINEPETIRAESFESARGWRELHFGGDGRLYFKRLSGGECQVLISFKRHQKRDERYLKTMG